MIRLAAIGCGDIARRTRFPDLLQHRADAELVAIAGRDRDKLRACADEFGVRRTYVDVDAMLSENDIDGVLILTPPSAHANHAVAALEAGKHTLLEKPMTTTLDDANRILVAAQDTSVVVSPLPDVATAEHSLVRAFLEAGAVGTVTGVECHRGHRGPTHADWFYRQEIAGGGVLLDLGIYALTEIADLFGPTARLNALCATRFPHRTLDDGSNVEVDVEDVALVDLWLQRGIAASVHASWNGYPSHQQTRTRTTVIGREGMLAYGLAGGSIVLHRTDGRYPEGGAPARLDGLDGRAYVAKTKQRLSGSVVGRFIERIAKGDVDLGPLRRQVNVMEEVLGAYARSGSARTIEPASEF